MLLELLGIDPGSAIWVVIAPVLGFILGIGISILSAIGMFLAALGAYLDWL